MKYKTAFINGKIYTVNQAREWAEAVVTINNKILFVGSNDGAKEFIDKHTEIIDLENRLMLPGFIDGHAHIVMGGEYLLSVDLQPVKSIDEFKKVLKEYISVHKGEWIFGGNWNHENWENGVLPHKDWIDEFSPDTPVFVSRMDYHMALANTKTLELANITKETPDPVGGTIVRDEKTGEPTGLLKDKAMDLVYNVIPTPTDEHFAKAIDAAMLEAKRFGVTSIHDISYKHHFKALQKAEKEGRLTVRTYSRLLIENYKNFINSEITHSFGSDRLRIGSMKAFADGSLGSGTALMYEPFNDEPGNTGLAMDILEDDSLEKWAIECDKNKLQLSIHAIGDKANNEILNLAEKLNKENPPWDRRFRIEHTQHLSKADIQRFAELNVIASMQPYHLYDDGCWAEKKLGSDRIKRSWAFKSLMDSGAKVCFGSDWSVATLDPIKGIYAAVTRHTADGKNPNGFVPDEKITVEQAVECYTINCAYAAYMENEIGSIEKGKFADLVVLSENIFEIEKEKIKDVFVELTIFDGEIIYKT